MHEPFKYLSRSLFESQMVWFQYFKVERMLSTGTISNQNVKMLVSFVGSESNSPNMKKHFVLSPALAQTMLPSSTLKRKFPGALCVFYYLYYFFSYCRVQLS